MNNKLFEELSRLYFLEEQAYHIQRKDGAYLPVADCVTASLLNRHFVGSMTIALDVISKEGSVKTAVIDLDGAACDKGPEHVRALKVLYRALSQDLNLPQPLLSISGKKGFGIWLSFSSPLPVQQVQTFLRALYKKYLSNILSSEIDLRPDTSEYTNSGKAVIKLPPCLHQVNQKWSAFISIEAIDSFISTPWLEQKPCLEQQATLLASAVSITPQQFSHALEKLTLELKNQGINLNEEKKLDVPNFAALPDNLYLPPCISALVNEGVPHEMDYNTANYNLSNYCHSAGLSNEDSIRLATEMAKNSNSHPTSKGTINKKINNFASNKTKQSFACNFPRGIKAWREAFGGHSTCNTCPLNSSHHETSNLNAANEDTRAEISKCILQENVALDLLSYAWRNGIDISHIENIWPLIKIPYLFYFETKDPEKSTALNLYLDWYKLAAKLSMSNASNASFLQATANYIYNHKDYDYVRKTYKEIKLIIATKQNNPKIEFKGTPPEELALAYQQVFFETIINRQVDKASGESTLQYADTLEAKTKIKKEANKAADNPSLSVSDLAAHLGKTLNEVIRREIQDTPFGNRALPILQDIFAHKRYIATPFSHLNYLLGGGFCKGKLYVLIAPPKAGKTTWAANCMDYAAANGHPVLYVGYEMGRSQMVLYGISRKTGFNSSKIEAVQLTEEEEDSLLAAFKSYMENEGKFLTLAEASSDFTLANIIGWLALSKDLHNDKIPLVVIDYLQIAFAGIKEVDNQSSASERVSQLAVMCKQIARQNEVSLLVLSAVTKMGESDSINKGKLEVTAARDSLAIIHAADGVLNLQSNMAIIKTKEKGKKATTQTIDPWQALALFYSEKGNEAESNRIIAGIQRNNSKYPTLKSDTRSVLYLERHRGATGEVPLYYKKGSHSFEEVALSQTHKAFYEKGDPTRLLFKANNLFISDEKSEIVSTETETTLTNNSSPTMDTVEPVSIVSSPIKEKESVSYQYITDLETARAKIKKLTGTVALDLETTGLDPLTDQIRLLSLHDGSTSLVIDTFSLGGAHHLKVEIEALDTLGHNSIFEISMLAQCGIEIVPHCTMIGHHILTGEQKSLEKLCIEYLDKPLNKEQQTSNWGQPTLTIAQLEYAALDVIITLEIWNKIKIELEETDSLKVYNIYKKAQPAIAQMELTGIYFNQEEHAHFCTSLETRRNKILEVLQKELNGRSPTSSTQLSQWLTEQLGGIDSNKYQKWTKTDSGKHLSTSEDELNKNLDLLPKEARTIVKDFLLPLKKTEKNISSYGQSLSCKLHPITNRVHPSFNLIGARTGRMSCADPNLQNMPREKEFRRFFEAAKGKKFIIADYSQIELRVAAEVAPEHKLRDALKQGFDAHRHTAALMLNVSMEEISEKGEARSAAKAVNFGMLYGMGARGLAQSASKPPYSVAMSETKAKEHIANWFKIYPGFAKWHARIKHESGLNYMVSTPAGRKRKWSKLDYKFTSAINTPPQGGAAEVMLTALGKLFYSLKPFQAKILGVIHDEVIVECDEDVAHDVLRIVEQDMTQAMLNLFPDAPTIKLIESSIAKNWGEKK